ncbi:HpcH/HpaI aldolase/citrate lyase family protein [Ectobacillus funiculus]
MNNEEGFANEVKLIKKLGFDGKSVINPRQIGIVNDIYTPSQKEIDKSIRVIIAAEDARKKGSGVVSLDGKMVDKPIIERAQRTLMLAEAAGVYVSKGGEEIA